MQPTHTAELSLSFRVADDAKHDRQVVGAVKEVTQRGVRFADGKEEQFDAIILATGYRSNVPSWLKVKFATPPS